MSADKLKRKVMEGGTKRILIRTSAMVRCEGRCAI